MQKYLISGIFFFTVPCYSSLLCLKTIGVLVSNGPATDGSVIPVEYRRIRGLLIRAATCTFPKTGGTPAISRAMSSAMMMLTKGWTPVFAGVTGR